MLLDNHYYNCKKTYKNRYRIYYWMQIAGDEKYDRKSIYLFNHIIT